MVGNRAQSQNYLLPYLRPSIITVPVMGGKGFGSLVWFCLVCSAFIVVVSCLMPVEARREH